MPRSFSNRRFIRPVAAASAIAVSASLLVACGSEDGVKISGSSTIYPITEAIAKRAEVSVDMEDEGTNTGFERFCDGETQINNASEAISEEYIEQCKDNDVEFIELPIALDTLAVVVNRDNNFANDLSMDQLNTIWGKDSTVTNWDEVDPDYPDKELSLYGRAEGSGTFDYFTYYVNGTAGEIREDYEHTDDLQEMAKWISEDEGGLGFMGAGNYLNAPEEVRNNLMTVAVDGVEPTLNNAQNGTYEPLTRPLFIYVNAEAVNDENVTTLVDTYLDDAPRVLPTVYFYSLENRTYEKVKQRWNSRTTGSVYEGDPFDSTPVAKLLD